MSMVGFLRLSMVVLWHLMAVLCRLMTVLWPLIVFLWQNIYLIGFLSSFLAVIDLMGLLSFLNDFLVRVSFLSEQIKKKCVCRIVELKAWHNGNMKQKSNGLTRVGSMKLNLFKHTI